MASVKISVNELAAQKAAYIKAAKNVRDVLVTVKNARSSIGNDKMLAGAKESLGKIADRLEKRASALERLAKLIDNATSCYTSAQKRSVTVITDLKAHKTDFYGNPVHVSATAAGASVAGATTVNITQNYYTTGAAVSSEAPSPAASVSSGDSAADSGGSTVVNNYYNETVIYNNPEPAAAASPEAVTGAADAVHEPAAYAETSADIPEAVTAETVSAAGAAKNIPINDAAEPATGEGLNGALGAGLFGGGAALGAAGVGAAEYITDKYKAGAQKRKIDKQLQEARKKMVAIESEEAQLKASLSENESNS